ncbi:hypothetical protein HDF19_14915 [Mucilaginibacter sp. E4BP6]|uniref:hypothetical protein n=1 Tax=Mucilaginibacter sp. E4BP6 TaxID=2723089 RepID=UPI0015CB0185|nr:hypothetical protein [Mucilaginibacter sp. E4BP6]NYE65718.1 hypothetical protein [Mucilaginibacter sp. E4BP6]
MKVEEIYKQALAEINYIRETNGLQGLVFSITTSPNQVYGALKKSPKVTFWYSPQSGEMQKIYERIVKELVLPSDGTPPGQFLYIQVTNWY